LLKPLCLIGAVLCGWWKTNRCILPGDADFLPQIVNRSWHMTRFWLPFVSKSSDP